MRRTITFYYDPKEKLLQTLTCQWETPSVYKVISSWVEPVIGDFDLSGYAARHALMVGADNVRAYTIQAVEF